LVEFIPSDLTFGRLQPDVDPTSEKGIQLPRSSQLEVRPVVERYKGVARQAIGVLTAGRHRESEAFEVCRGHTEISDEYHQVVQTG
jgi:hypothetical protein